MAADKNILEEVRKSAARRILFLPHALHQMNAPERMISTEEIRQVVFHGEVIEDYPEDARGHSCLMLGWGYGGRPIHVVCAPKWLWCINRPLLGANGETSPILDFQPGYEFPGVLSQVTA
jgi:hypothetical protein